MACPADRANCNSAIADGCEVALLTDAANCGACNRACVVDHATPACAGGACAVGRCDDGFGNCDGIAANGCETSLNTSATSCGSCGRVCAAPYGGSATCAAGACGGSCPSGQTLLSNFVCANTSSDPNWCGASQAHCAVGQVCTAGACVAEPRTACGRSAPPGTASRPSRGAS